MNRPPHRRSGEPDPADPEPGPPHSPSLRWCTARGMLSLEVPLVMGVLNTTPDSFSDGGELPTPDHALRRAEAMARAGAGILDVGGESTRPGAAAVSTEAELRRVVPVVEALVRELDLPVSVDTRKAAVARRAVEAGAAVVNDVSGLAFDPEMGRTVGELGAGVVLMHMRGTPADMQTRAEYRDVTGEVARELGQAVRRARDAGVGKEAMVLDPGIGFAKTPSQSFRLLRELDRVAALGYPVMVGPSRKSFLGELLGVPPQERVVATAVTCALALERGALLFRVHDVEATVHALSVARAVVLGDLPGDPRQPVGVEEDGAARPDRRRVRGRKEAREAG
jgi:dihydropteroate synthase